VIGRGVALPFVVTVVALRLREGLRGPFGLDLAGRCIALIALSGRVLRGLAAIPAAVLALLVALAFLPLPIVFAATLAAASIA